MILIILHFYSYQVSSVHFSFDSAFPSVHRVVSCGSLNSSNSVGGFFFLANYDINAWILSKKWFDLLYYIKLKRFTV